MKRLLVIGVLVALCVPALAIAHGSVDGFFTGPNKSGEDEITVNIGASSSDQHNRIKTVTTVQRKTGTSWNLVGSDTSNWYNTRGYTATARIDCLGTVQGSTTYRTKWETWWYNDAGGVAHHKGPTFSNGVGISGSTCYND